VKGLDKDAEQAASWYRRAAEAGHRQRRSSNLGLMLLLDGEGVDKDAEQAMSLVPTLQLRRVTLRRSSNLGYSYC